MAVVRGKVIQITPSLLLFNMSCTLFAKVLQKASVEGPFGSVTALKNPLLLYLELIMVRSLINVVGKKKYGAQVEKICFVILKNM